MSNHTVDTSTVELRNHVIDEATNLFIGTGICYMKSPIGTSGEIFYHAISPIQAQDILKENPHSKKTVTKPIYETNRVIYVAGDRPDGVNVVTDYLVDGTVYKYEEEVPIENGWVKLANGWSDVDDVYHPAETFEERIESGDITPLWPIWKKAHR